MFSHAFWKVIIHSDDISIIFMKVYSFLKSRLCGISLGDQYSLYEKITLKGDI